MSFKICLYNKRIGSSASFPLQGKEAEGQKVEIFFECILFKINKKVL